jgi:hypothetical protein
MDGNENVGVKVVGSLRTLEQTRQLRSAGDQSDGTIQACLVQRLRDNVDELEVEFVFWHTTEAVRARRSRRVAYINERPKRRWAQPPPLAACCIVESSARQVVPASIIASATIGRRAPL